MKKFIRVILASVFISGSGITQAITGNELLADLDDDGYFSKGFAMGFIVAVTESFVGYGFAKECLVLPNGVSNGQLKDIVRKFLENNPETRHYQAPVLITFALRQSYSVKDQSQNGYCE